VPDLPELLVDKFVKFTGRIDNDPFDWYLFMKGRVQSLEVDSNPRVSLEQPSATARATARMDEVIVKEGDSSVQLFYLFRLR